MSNDGGTPEPESAPPTLTQPDEPPDELPGEAAAVVVAEPVAAQRPVKARRGDMRWWIYGSLDVVFSIVYAIAIWKVVPNRLPSAAAHLWSIPVATLVLAIGTLMGGRRGWWVAVIGGSAVLASTFLLIVRIVISAAFLSGVYGAFGKAAATFAMVMVALIVEIVALLPIVQVKYLMTRAGRRAYGMPERAA